MNEAYPENHIPENIIHAVGAIFLTVGVILLTIALFNLLKVEVNNGSMVGIGIVSGIFGAVLLLHKIISKTTSLIGTLLFYCLAIAGTILSLYNPEIVELLIWMVSISSVIAMFFTLTLAAKATINPGSEEEA
ncbi:MAG: hypothetical protein WD022_06785 [Balneolaceae bacterium]